MQSQNLPVPYMGLNTKYPLAMLKAPFAEGIINFNPVDGGVVLRHGDKFEYSGTATGDNLDIVTIDDDNLIILSFNAVTNIYFTDALTNTLLYTSPAIAAGVYPVINAGFFHRYTFFWGCNAVRSDAGVWGAIGYSGGVDTTGIGSCPYKNRNYIINKDSTKYNYSEINAISGFTHEVDLKDVSTTGANIALVTRITISDNVSTVDLLTFVLWSGEVLFFSGSYPDSSTWTIVGRATIGKPLNYMNGIAYASDFLVFCTTGPTSLRDVFLKGDRQVESTDFGDAISGIWKAITSVTTTETYPMKGVWDKRENRLVIFFPGFSDTPDWIPTGSPYTGGTYFLIYNTELLCWYLHFTPAIPGLGSYFTMTKGVTIFRDAVYYLGNNPDAPLTWLVMKKEGTTDWADQDQDGEPLQMPGYILSAPVILNDSKIMKCDGMEMIMENGFGNSTYVKLIGNLGQTTTSPQSVIGTDTGIQNQYFNVGIDSLLAQYELTCTSLEDATVGLNIYSISLWLSAGGSPR